MSILIIDLLAILMAFPASANEPKRSVIYGDDSRHEVFEEKDARIAILAESTVALVDNQALGPGTRGSFRLRGRTLANENKLCQTERFREQTAGANCTGFLATPNTIVTAGHCIETEDECKRTAFVFDYAYRKSDAHPNLIPQQNVYRCGRLIRAVNTDRGDDYAIIELDRIVRNRRPLELESRSQIQRLDSIFVIGHPGGIPAKIADGAAVREIPTRKRLIADLDVYGGNSGSPVFNTVTRKVEGILVDGAEDFVMTSKGCRVSQRCRRDSCSGEAVVRISRVLPYLGDLEL